MKSHESNKKKKNDKQTMSGILSMIVNGPWITVYKYVRFETRICLELRQFKVRICQIQNLSFELSDKFPLDVEQIFSQRFFIFVHTYTLKWNKIFLLKMLRVFNRLFLKKDILSTEINHKSDKGRFNLPHFEMSGICSFQILGRPDFVASGYFRPDFEAPEFVRPDFDRELEK